MPSGGPASAWLGCGGFSASGVAEVRQEQDGGRTRLLIDADGDGTADAALDLQGGVLLTPADLVL